MSTDQTSLQRVASEKFGTYGGFCHIARGCKEGTHDDRVIGRYSSLEDACFCPISTGQTSPCLT